MSIVEDYYKQAQSRLDNYLNDYIGHDIIHGELDRTFEVMELNEFNRINNRAITRHIEIVNTFAKSNNRQVSRVYITLEQDWVLCEAFYKEPV